MATGAELSERYYRRLIAPALASRWPGLPHAAGRVGSGSDVLGYDDGTSRDHDWGLRLSILVGAEMTTAVSEHLAAVVPEEFDGLPTRPELTWIGERSLAVEVSSVDELARARLGVGAEEDWSTIDWMGFTGQAVLEIRAGPVFFDGAGDLTRLRHRLEWYPDEVWRWAVAAAWFALSEELPFVGRAGERGDDLGSRVIGARLARVAMQLGLLLTKTWAPYSKWLGTAFAELETLSPARADLERAVRADTWQDRQRFLGSALEQLASLQRRAGLPVADPAIGPFFDRPHLGVRATHELLLDSIDDRELRERRLTGVVEQWCESVPALVSPGWRRERA